MDSTMAHQGYRCDEYTVDTGRRALQRNGEPIPLPSRAFDTLAYLIEHRDRCVHKDEIIGAIWNDVVVTDDSLIHAISALRRALGDGRRQPRFIQTVPRRGYRFVGSVEPIGRPPGASDPDVVRDADEYAAGDTAVMPQQARRIQLGRPERLVGLAAVLAVILAVFFVDRRGPSDATPAAAGIRLFQPAPEGASIVSGGVLSPDGRQLAFVARDDASGKTALWIRALHTSELRRLDGTDGASKPFWSPDSGGIAFFANGSLIALDLGSESTQTVATVFAAGGGTWGADDTILFAEWTGGLYAVPASGDGDVATVATLDRQADDIAFAWPQFFPDSRRFLYQVVSLDPTRSGVYVGDLLSGEHFRLLETTSAATLAPPHHVLHVDNDMLIAEELDPDRLELTGRAIVVARGLSEPTLATENMVSASADLLAFQHGLRRQNLAWFSRAGEELDALALPTMLFNPRISPDGSRLLGSGSVTKDPGLWLVKLDREEFSRLEDDAIGPIWSRDGRRIAFTSRSGFDLVVRSVDSSDDRRLLASDDGVKILNDWSPDGRRLVYTRQGASTDLDLWVIDVSTGAAEPLLASAASETQARISPDGEWVAYASDESGVLEVYVARFPELDRRRMVSNGGGGQPQWRTDRSELYYLSPDRTIMAVAVVDDADPIDFGSPQRLFRAATAGDPGDARDHFASDADGTRFLIDSAVSENDGQAITVMVNWSSDLHD
jgi:Tol biopolymer transport system component/DNA-binding winged helix-turn-helix (wHTH) protein